LRKFALILFTLLVLAGCSAQGEVRATDLWVKSSEVSTIGGMSVVYGTLTNNTTNDIVLIGGQTDLAGIVEVHEMAMINGELKMQQIAGGLLIPAGQSIQLEPGGTTDAYAANQRFISRGRNISHLLFLRAQMILWSTGFLQSLLRAAMRSTTPLKQKWSTNWLVEEGFLEVERQ